jgi:2-C-methyl-D-erythritol 4-phosphate cytidylyltransferase
MLKEGRRCPWWKAATAPALSRTLGEVGTDIDLVAVHDAVRPFIDPATIEKTIQEGAIRCGDQGTVPVIPSSR